jgi:hypothetical protein
MGITIHYCSVDTLRRSCRTVSAALFHAMLFHMECRTRSEFSPGKGADFTTDIKRNYSHGKAVIAILRHLGKAISSFYYFIKTVTTYRKSSHGCYKFKKILLFT